MNPNLVYRPDIDGLRAVAVMAVVLHHLSASLVPGGYVGVDVFFVISGYLITGIISREMETDTFTFARFYVRRARRIFPALFVVLAVTLGVGYALLLPSDYTATLRGALGTLFFGSNIVFWREMKHGYFAATDAGLNPLLHTWSLGVEEQFYVFFPVLLLLCYRYIRHHLILILVTCAVVSFAGATLLVQSKSVAVFFLSPFRAWELIVGSLLALKAVPVIRSREMREVVAGAGLLVILAACVMYDDKTTFPGLTAVAPVLGAAAILHAGVSGNTFTSRMLQWQPFIYIGLISYSLYLWHWPLIVLTRYAMGMESITPFFPALLVPYWLLFLLIASRAKVRLPFAAHASAKWSDWWRLTFVLLVLMIGLRHEIGADWFSYAEHVRLASFEPLDELLLKSDPAYKLLNWLAARLDWGPYFVNTVCAALFAWGLLVFCRAQPLPWLALVVAVPYLVIVVTQGHVRYLGVSDDVRTEIAMADCIVLPSFYPEGTPRTLLEAAAMARPIITTNAVGCREVVEDGINGYLCQIRDANDLADKMERMLRLSPAHRTEMGLRGRAKMEAEFDEQIVIKKYLAAVQEAVGAKGL